MAHKKVSVVLRTAANQKANDLVLRSMVDLNVKQVTLSSVNVVQFTTLV